MARKLGLKSDGDTDVLALRVQEELKFHSYDYLKNESVFKPAMNQGARSVSFNSKPPPIPAVSLGPSPIMLRDIRTSMVEAASCSKAIADAASDETEVTNVDTMMASQPMSAEEMQVTLLELARNQREIQKTLQLHHKGINSCVLGMHRLSEATSANAIEHDALRKAIAEMEQSIASVAVDASEDVSSVRASLVTASTRIDSAQLTANRAQTSVGDVSARVDNVEKTLGSVTFSQEIADRALRAHNVLVYGWPVASNPLADAVEFLQLINYSQHEYVTARRYNSLRRLPMHMDKPPILNITFPTVKHARDAMAAYRIHSGGTRDFSYWTKPDLTKRQLDLKKHADEGIRVLLEKEPYRIYRERSGRIAEFRRLASGELVFDKWIVDPLQTTADPYLERPQAQPPQVSSSSLGKQTRDSGAPSRVESDADDSDVERASSAPGRQSFRRNFSDDGAFFTPATSAPDGLNTTIARSGRPPTGPGPDNDLYTDGRRRPSLGDDGGDGDLQMGL